MSFQMLRAASSVPIVRRVGSTGFVSSLSDRFSNRSVISAGGGCAVASTQEGNQCFRMMMIEPAVSGTAHCAMSIRHFATAKKKKELKAAAKKKVNQGKSKFKYDPIKEAMGEKDRMTEMLMSAVDAPRTKEPPISQEEKDRRYEVGRNHVIGRFRYHNEHYHDVNCKLYLKHHALKMLKKHTKLFDDATTQYEGKEEEEPEYMSCPGPRHIPGLWEHLHAPYQKKEESID